MKDIENKEDIAFLMNEFYSKMLNDDEIGYIFTDVAHLDLEKHLPSLTNFWENMLLNPNGYKKNVMDIHFQLNNKEKLLPIHFNRWLELLAETVNEHYKGEKAQRMLNSANSIAGVMQFKLKTHP
jgi:hemoglobin